MDHVIEQKVVLTPPQVTAETRLRVWLAGSSPRASAVLLAPAARSSLDERVLSTVARGLSARGVTVGTFNFAYRQAGRRLPDPRPRLEQAYRDVLSVFADLVPARAHVLGGRSMGGRIASHLAAGGAAAGVIALAYPLWPRGEPDARRTAHWPAITVPVLFVHGDRDRLCPVTALDDARAAHLRGTQSTAHVVAGADHGFALQARDPRTAADVGAELVAAIDGWLADTFEASTSNVEVPAGEPRPTEEHHDG